MNTPGQIKVVIVVNNLNIGGVSSLVSSLVDHPSKKYAYEIVNLGKNEDKSLLEQLKLLHIPVHHLEYAFVEGYSVLDYFKKAFATGKFLNDNLKIIEKLIELQPDILHFHTLPHELLFGQEVSKKINCQLVYTDHTRRIDPSEISFISRSLIKFPFHEFYRSYNVIAVSESVLGYVRELKIDNAAKSVKLITNKMAKTDKRITYAKKHELKVVYVARIAEGKGHVDLLNAWNSLPPLDLHLFLVGPEEIDVRDLVNKDLNNKVTFTGARSDVKEFINDADMGVFPSHKEGLPLALLEKMQLGIPCIVSNIAELTCIVQNNVSGLVFERENSEALAAAITELSNDPKKREALGQAAAQLINEKYVSKVGGMQNEYELYYDELFS